MKKYLEEVANNVELANESVQSAYDCLESICDLFNDFMNDAYAFIDKMKQYEKK